MTKISIDIENLSKIQKLPDEDFLELFHNFCNYLLMYQRKDSAGYQSIHYQVSPHIRPYFEELINGIKDSKTINKEIDFNTSPFKNYLDLYNKYQNETEIFFEKLDNFKEE